MTATPTACPACLRRSWLLGILAPHIERIATGAPGSRSHELLRLSNQALVAVAASASILERVEALSEQHLRRQLEEANCWACCRHDDAYPHSLRNSPDSPWALICRGNADLLGDLRAEPSVTVVGARRATSYGREVARELARELAAAGLLVISGLAFGIDACAHRGALDGGRTVAVLGCGADVAYPAAHRSLWRRVTEHGLVLSELPPGTTPWRWAFPARNRIMAALSGMTVVVEAAERSGSLITSDLAADLGRRLGAVPGPINARTSAGPNALLAGGARVVRDAQDVLDALGGRRPPPEPARGSEFSLDRDRCRRDLLDPDGALWPVNAYSDVDELGNLLEAALSAGLIDRRDPRTHLFLYPLSLSEPDPVPALRTADGTTLLGHALGLREREEEDPVAFTLRLLEEIAGEANRLLAGNAGG